MKPHLDKSWKSYSPTFTNLNSKNIKLPNGKINNYYWSKLHIVTTVYEYIQEGKIVNFRTSFKYLSLWESLKFIIRTTLTKKVQ